MPRRKLNSTIQIAPLRGLVIGFNYYDSTHEDWYEEEVDDYFEHYTIFLFIIAIRILRE